ncbi:ABC transporter family substrate-binding protein [Streptomyces sp. ICBB 8177]|uniref:ABC transporter family substrate-binding protein n=1 Tax=Streptomyces sp. ICBB 8177 TaxID=563922 RepID=UPI000D672B75|nr:ABC transporter family substrate-binding protein [Streptomyces sp. ICBB 8177]PWI43918.1 hypothetical protein CK485_17810 [Streptomyces sp. ICBB 8177]
MHRTPRARRRAAGAAAAAGVLAAAALAGCSPSSDADHVPAAVDVASASRGAVKDGGTLRWAVDDIPGTLNTFQAAADQETSQIAAATLPSLFTVDGEGRPQRDGDFLQSAKVTSTKPQTVVYQLNPKAVWSNGRPLSAADFTAQWKALSGANAAFWSAHNAGYDRIASVRQGKDAHEVEVTFKEPMAAWQSLFTPLYPKEVTGTPDAFNDSARDSLKVSAGPFAVQSVDTSAGTATLARNPKWWGDRAKLSHLVFKAVPTARRAAALADGTVDVARIDTSAQARVEGERGIRVHRTLDPSYAQLTLNGASGPLADQRVRQAVARAIDRQAIATYVLKPAGLPASTLGNHLVLGSQYGYRDDSSAVGGTDVKSAQALLADAGWQQGHAAQATPGAKAAGPQPGKPAPSGSASASGSASPSASASASASPSGSGAADGDGTEAADATQSAGAAQAADQQAIVQPAAVRTNKAGHPLALRFVLPQDSPTLDAVGDRIAHMLAAVGVRTEIDKVSDDSFFHDHIASGDFDLALYDWPGSAYPAYDARPVYGKPVPAADGSLTVRENYSRVGTDRIDQLLDQAGDELDQGRAQDLTAQADERIWAEAGSVPLYQPPQLVATRTSVANAGAFGFLTPRYQDIGFRK